jgi:hypothetical protein
VAQLHQQIATVITSGKQTAYRAINVAMTLTYWEIGRLIVEEEQNGKERLIMVIILSFPLPSGFKKSLEAVIRNRVSEIIEAFSKHFQFAPQCGAN